MKRAQIEAGGIYGLKYSYYSTAQPFKVLMVEPVGTYAHVPYGHTGDPMGYVPKSEKGAHGVWGIMLDPLTLGPKHPNTKPNAVNIGHLKGPWGEFQKQAEEQAEQQKAANAEAELKEAKKNQMLVRLNTMKEQLEGTCLTPVLQRVSTEQGLVNRFALIVSDEALLDHVVSLIQTQAGLIAEGKVDEPSPETEAALQAMGVTKLHAFTPYSKDLDEKVEHAISAAIDFTSVDEMESAPMQAEPEHYKSVLGKTAAEVDEMYEESKLSKGVEGVFTTTATNYIIQGSSFINVTDADGKVLKGGTA